MFIDQAVVSISFSELIKGRLDKSPVVVIIVLACKKVALYLLYSKT
jgi:hypothetical protein